MRNTRLLAMTKKFVFDTLSMRQINNLRKIKWFFLTFIANDLSTIKRFYEEEIEIRILERLINRGDVVIDIGANIGCYSYHLAHFVFSTGRVISFEPRSNIHDRLKRQLKEFQHCTVEQLGVSNAETIGDLYLPTSHGRSSLVKHDDFVGFRSEKIQLVTLDQYIDKDGTRALAFIKIDVEGHEYEVIHGAGRTLRTYHPLVLCESEDRHLEVQGKSVRMFLELMRGYNYNSYVVEEFKLVPAAGIKAKDNGKHFYNYWFIHQEDTELLVRFRNVLGALKMGQ